MPDWINVVWSSLVAIAVLFLMTKLLGYRQIYQLNYFQYITGITIGSIAAMTSTHVESLANGLAALAVWAGVTVCIEWVSLKSKGARNLFGGKGVVLIQEGKVLEDNLKKVRYSTDDLMEQLRSKNAFKAADVEFAMLEPTGQVSVLMKKENQPMTPKLMGLDTPTEREPQTVIMDGNMMEEPLATAGYNPGWLYEQLNKIGVTLDNVFLGQLDGYGQLYIDIYDDKISVPEPQEKKLLLASLKKGAADIELFALATENQKAKQMYTEALDQLNGVIQDVSPYLKS